MFVVSNSVIPLPGRRVDVHDLAIELDQPDFVFLISKFLQEQSHFNTRAEPTSDSLLSNGPTTSLPRFRESVSVYTSAVATFYAPSDICGTGGMRRERIHAVPSWRGGAGRYDCAFINTDPTAEGMRGLDVARVRLFFSFKYNDTFYPCALVHWFSRVGESADEDVGMWIVEPDFDVDGRPKAAVLHLDTFVRAAHLIGINGKNFLPKGLSFSDSLNIFRAYYVNKFIDHHSFEIAF